MLAKTLIAASLAGALLLTSPTTSAQSASGAGTAGANAGADAYLSGSGTVQPIMDRKCNFRLGTPNYFTCNITATTRCRAGFFVPLGVTWCISFP